jgi:hypothetical protein
MAFAQNPAQFFDTQNGFAVEAVFKTAAGVQIRVAKVIFIDAVDFVPVFEQSIQKPLPSIHCISADLVDVDSTCTVTIAGVTYRMQPAQHFGLTKTALVQLNK